MKLFLVDWTNNYGLDCLVIEANSEDEAENFLKDNNNIWWAFANITEIKITGIAGTITKPFNQS